MLNGLVDLIDRRLRVLHSITEFTGLGTAFSTCGWASTANELGRRTGQSSMPEPVSSSCICGMNTSYLFLRADPGWAGRAG